MPEEPKTHEPRALSAEYHKARKQLMLWAAILFIWELVGIDLEKAKEAGGNAGAIIGAIKSPQAIPWALLVLVGYFLFRFTVEWYQSHPARRRMRVAKVDFRAAWIVSLAAYALYFGQTISRVQLADRLHTTSNMLFFALSLIMGINFGNGIMDVWEARRESKPIHIRSWLLLIFALLGFPIVAVSSRVAFPLYMATLLVFMVIGVFLLASPLLLKVMGSRREARRVP